MRILIRESQNIFERKNDMDTIEQIDAAQKSIRDYLFRIWGDPYKKDTYDFLDNQLGKHGIDYSIWEISGKRMMGLKVPLGDETTKGLGDIVLLFFDDIEFRYNGSYGPPNYIMLGVPGDGDKDYFIKSIPYFFTNKENTFKHEITHMLDHRKGKVQNTSKLGDSDYVNSPVEVNAHFTEAINTILDGLNQQYETHKPHITNFSDTDMFVRLLIPLESPQQFTSYLMREYMGVRRTKRGGDREPSAELKRRLMKRASQLYEKIKQKYIKKAEDDKNRT